jgi:hypothetical protein
MHRHPRNAPTLGAVRWGRGSLIWNKIMQADYFAEHLRRVLDNAIGA